MSRFFVAILLVFCAVVSSQGAIYDTAPMAHDVKTKTISSPWVHGVSPRTGVNVDISNMNSWDEEFDASNETPSFDIASLAGFAPGTEVTIVGIGWDVDIQVQGFSWFSEAILKIGDELATPALFLQPGVGDDFDSMTPKHYSSGGILNFAMNGLPDLVLTDGVAQFELYELFDDVPDAIDATYLANSTITFDVQGLDLPGDFDGNGVYACPDVDALVGEIVAGTNTPEFDLTGDGNVNNDDLSEWLSIAGAAELPSGNPYLPADMNLDGFVDGLDFIIWNDNRFTSIAEFCAGDVNADGVVDGSDFIVWNDHRFTSSGDSVAVPEPACGSALLLIGLLTFRRRR